MKIIGVIPARYKSSRFEGKPLVDICGKPMIWWTYHQAKKSKELSEVYIATDSKLIFDKCKELSMNVIMTRDDHSMMLERIWEVSEKMRETIKLSQQKETADSPFTDGKTYSNEQ